jgi:hypothetical protein
VQTRACLCACQVRLEVGTGTAAAPAVRGGSQLRFRFMFREVGTRRAKYTSTHLSELRLGFCVCRRWVGPTEAADLSALDPLACRARAQASGHTAGCWLWRLGLTDRSSNLLSATTLCACSHFAARHRYSQQCTLEIAIIRHQSQQRSVRFEWVPLVHRAQLVAAPVWRACRPTSRATSSPA